MAMTQRLSTRLPDLQRPPRTLPISAPKLGTILPSDMPRWKRAWKAFLFGKDFPQKFSRRNLRIRQIGAAVVRHGIKCLRIRYNVDKGVTVDAFLLRPTRSRGRLPGVVLFHETNSETKGIDHPWKAAASLNPRPARNIAAHVARLGFVVIVPRCFIFAGRKLPRRKAWNFKAEVKQMTKLHPTWKGLARMIVDGIRAVDVLHAQTDVDPDRIGAIGHSLGGKQIPYVMAFDHRIKAGVSSDGGIGLRFSNWNDEWYLGRAIHYRELENNQILSMIAPRAFLLVGGKYDDDRVWPFIAGAIPIWKAKGAPDSIGWFRHGNGHCWPFEAQKVGYPFLWQHLTR